MKQNILNQLSEAADQNNQPISCDLELTRQCNFRCKHCYLPLKDRKSRGCISRESAKRFIEELKKMGGFNITFTGGEPLLFSDILIDLMKYARKVGLIAVLFTNASLMTEEIADKIVETLPAEVGITLYGINEKEYKDFTGISGAFKKTIRGIQLLVERKTRVQVRWQVTKNNYKRFTDYLTMVRELGAKPSFNTNLNLNIDNSTSPEDLTLEEKQYREFIDILSNLDVFEDFLKRYKKVKNNKLKIAKIPCSTGRSNVYIKADGTVLPCSQLLIPLGNIDNEKFTDIWSNKNGKVKVIRDLTMANLKCAQCDKNLYCQICMGDFYIKNHCLSQPNDFSCKKASIEKNISEYIINKYLSEGAANEKISVQ